MNSRNTAQPYRAFGTAAELTVVPADHAVPLPDQVSDEVSAGLGIPSITAHRAVFNDGPVDGSTVLVHGVPGGVASMAPARRLEGRNCDRHKSGAGDFANVDDAVAHCEALDEGERSRRSAASPPTACTASSKCRSPTPSTSTPPRRTQDGDRRLHHPAPPTGLRLADALREPGHTPARQRRPSSRRPQPTSPSPRTTHRFASPSTTRCHSIDSTKHTTASTQARQRVLLSIHDKPVHAAVASDDGREAKVPLVDERALVNPPGSGGSSSTRPRQGHAPTHTAAYPRASERCSGHSGSSAVSCRPRRSTTTARSQLDTELAPPKGVTHRC